MSRDIEIVLGGDAFEPGERLTGRVVSRVAAELQVELALGWSTEGKGDSDESCVASRTLRVPPCGEVSFELCLPEGPYSFSGQLISLQWALQAKARGGAGAALSRFVLAPHGRELRLPYRRAAPEEAKSAAWWRLW